MRKVGVAALVVAACVSVAAPASPARTRSNAPREDPSVAGTSAADCAGQITEYFGDHFGAMTPGGIATGPDGNLWFTDSGDSTTGGSRIGTMNTNGTVSAFYSAATDPHVHPAAAITAGPDASMWFIDTGEQANPQPNLVGKITLDGTLSEYSTGPDPADDPSQLIVTGADGNLWFPQAFTPGNARIAKMTPQGTVTSYPIGLPDVQVGNLVLGPDGNVWFSYWQDQPPGLPTGVAKVAPDGVVVTYAVTAPLRLVGGLTVGPDGNLWATSQANQGLSHSVVKFALDGASTVIPVAVDPHAFLGQIITGPDGNLWFTVGNAGDGSQNGIVRLKLDGTTTEYLEPPKPNNQNNLGRGITVGSDGNIWFTEFYAIASVQTGSCPIRIAPTFTG